MKLARVILIYGQPASGKSFSIKTLPPNQTLIIDADKKGTLPWKGSKTQFNAAKKNFFITGRLDKILKVLQGVKTLPDFENIKYAVIDGFNNAMMNEILFYDENAYGGKFEVYSAVAKKVVRIIDTAQSLRDDLTVVFIAHVETADPYAAGDVDKVFTPGKFLKDKIKLESKFNYVFYAKVEDGEFFFETAPNRSTARTPLGCFNGNISNDLYAAIETIRRYENGD